MPGLTIGDTLPNLEVDTTHGRIKLHDYVDDTFTIIFSHPGDFTPVCTTELGAMAAYADKFAQRGVKLLGLSCDDVASHKEWIKDIEAYNCRTREYDPQDHISKLPDEILCTILCFLTLKEAAVTSAVSRRWVHLWKSNTLLNFDATKALNSIGWKNKLTKTERVKYVNWVNHVLSVHQASEIEEFRICFDLYKAHKQDIDDWLKFAFSRRVQRLELDLLRWGMYVTKNIELIYAFPIELIFAQSIGTPSAHAQPNVGGSLSSSLLDVKPLRDLCLKHVNVTDEAIKVFLLNCPFLESLSLHGLPGLVNLEVSGQSLMLRYLEILHCEKLNSVKICNTNLVRIKFFGCCKQVLLQDLPFLVELYIGWFELVGDAFSKLSSCLPNLEILTFVFRHAGFYSANVKLLEIPELSRLKQLTLVLETTSDSSLLEFASLANVFPCLEKCAIELWFGESSACRGLRQLKKVPHCIHPCLKVVELRGYYGRKSDIELAMYFIKNAVALEELIVDPRYQKNTHFRAPKGKSEIDAEATAREIAKQQFKGMTVPGRIKLEIL